MNFSAIGLIFKKELSDLFRDRKTIVASFLVPLLMLPMMFYFMGNGIAKIMEQETINIVIKDDGNTSLGKYLKEKEDFTVKDMDIKKAEEKVKDGELDLAVVIPNEFEENIKKGTPSEVTIIYDNSGQTSSMSYSKVNEYIGEYSQGVVTKTLTDKGVDPTVLAPVVVKEKTVVDEESGQGMMMMSMMIPFFIVLYCVTGPMPAATDLGAGEKERGTLEPLLTTKASRVCILYGKLFAITVVGILTSVAAIGGMIISLKISPEMFGGGADGVSMSISIGAIGIIFLFTVLTAMVFGALELAISIYARSFKEAQTYSTPLMLLAFVPTFLMYTVDGKNIDSVYFNIPIANVMAVLKEITLGIVDINHILIVLGWSIVYVAVSVGIAAYMFKKENVIFRT